MDNTVIKPSMGSKQSTTPQIEILDDKDEKIKVIENLELAVIQLPLDPIQELIDDWTIIPNKSPYFKTATWPTQNP